MWNLLTRRRVECEAFGDELERLGSLSPDDADVNKLPGMLSPAATGHYGKCAKCREEAEYFLESRRIFGALDQNAPVPGPWFATKVLAAINERERDLAGREGVWTAVPKYATRLALVSAALLLAGTTWLLEKQIPGKTSGSTNEEYLFGAPAPQPSQDDVLVSMAERNP